MFIAIGIMLGSDGLWTDHHTAFVLRAAHNDIAGDDLAVEARQQIRIVLLAFPLYFSWLCVCLSWSCGLNGLHGCYNSAMWHHGVHMLVTMCRSSSTIAPPPPRILLF